MAETTLDVREVPPATRHSKIRETFATLERGDTLVLINDHDPKPLFYELQAEVDAFDADGYSVDQRSEDEFVATFPKK